MYQQGNYTVWVSSKL